MPLNCLKEENTLVLSSTPKELGIILDNLDSKMCLTPDFLYSKSKKMQFRFFYFEVRNFLKFMVPKVSEK